MERINIQTPLPGSPTANSPNLRNHENIAISITFFIPNLFKQKGISKIQSVSETCERDIKALALLAPQESAY